MSPIRRAVTTAGAVFVLAGASVAVPAALGSREGLAGVTVARAAVQTCGHRLKPAPHVDSVRIHRSPSTSSTVDGILYPGQTLSDANPKGDAEPCGVVSGNRYNACGHSDRAWVPVAYRGRIDYAARFCVVLVR